MNIDVNDQNFKEKVLDQSKKTPVVVDFWAPWCGPCRALKPLLERLAEEYKGKFVLAKMNVDENQLTPKAYGVMSIPSVKMVKNGKIVDEFTGALPEPAVKKWLNKNLGDE